MKNRFLSALLLILLCASMLLTGCDLADDVKGGISGIGKDKDEDSPKDKVVGYASVEGIPDYEGSPYIALNGNKPEFSDAEITVQSYEYYSELDGLGRCGVTMACIGTDIMPKDDREDIGSVKPSGWVNNKYSSELVDGGYIYNRCHLIGFQLTGENANKCNLITGTRYLNIEGMLPFENMVADYLKENEGNHVMYRVTPIFVGNNLVASGVKMEGYSVEDNGEGISFNVFSYNVQPGITINYATGDNWLNGDEVTEAPDETKEAVSGTEVPDFILNTKSKKIHQPTCASVDDIKDENRKDYCGSKQQLLDMGYMICGTCKP